MITIRYYLFNEPIIRVTLILLFLILFLPYVAFYKYVLFFRIFMTCLFLSGSTWDSIRFNFGSGIFTLELGIFNLRFIIRTINFLSFTSTCTLFSTSTKWRHFILLWNEWLNLYQKSRTQFCWYPWAWISSSRNIFTAVCWWNMPVHKKNKREIYIKNEFLHENI